MVKRTKEQKKEFALKANNERLSKAKSVLSKGGKILIDDAVICGELVVSDDIIKAYNLTKKDTQKLTLWSNSEKFQSVIGFKIINDMDMD